MEVVESSSKCGSSWKFMEARGSTGSRCTFYGSLMEATGSFMKIVEVGGSIYRRGIWKLVEAYTEYGRGSCN